MEGIKVSVVEFSDRKFYMMQWRDPMTGRKRTKSTGVERTGRKRERTEAERVAAKLEADLRESRYHDPSRTTWQEFRDRYSDEVLLSLAANTDKKTQIAFDQLQREISPEKLRDVTAQRLSYFQAQLRKRGLEETTIASYLRQLKSAFRWAVRVGLLPQAPAIEMPKRAKTGKLMKGRPVTAEEFDRMIDKTEDEVGSSRAELWQRDLRGLWLSGLRLSEALELSWDDDQGTLHVVLAGKFPMFRIPAESEKGHKERMLPMTPDFAEFLAETPEDARSGLVFSFLSTTGERYADRYSAGRVISAIGKRAGVKVSTTKRTGADKVKFASAHDLRRSFGERWARKIMPQVLMELMRHETMETTQKYYVGTNAEATASVLWALASNTPGNTTPSFGHSRPQSVDVTR